MEHSKDTTSLSFELSALNIFTEYSIWVVAANENGVGASSSEVVVRTYGSAPSEPPHNVTLEAGSSTVRGQQTRGIYKNSIGGRFYMVPGCMYIFDISLFGD